MKPNFLSDEMWAAIDKLPPLILCDACKALGYCRDSGSHLREMLYYEETFDLKKYLNRVPVTAVINYRNSTFERKHLQAAYDAFHQDDFETALLNFKAAGESNNPDAPVSYSLALTYFMMEDYEQAASNMVAYLTLKYLNEKLANCFLDECARREKLKQEKEMDTPNEPKLVAPEESKGVRITRMENSCCY